MEIINRACSTCEEKINKRSIIKLARARESRIFLHEEKDRDIEGGR